MADVIIGAQWGDEGKGKIVDAISGGYDFCVRFNGGNNAGHTIHNEHGEIALHLIPAGIFREHVTCVIGNGVVVHPQSLWTEISEVVGKGVSLDSLASRLTISSRAHVVMPWHIVMDKLQEVSRAREKIGTTSRGIGPVFADKVARHGMRMGDFVRMRERDFRAWFAKEFYRNVKIARALYGSIALGFSREIEEEAGMSSAEPHIRELLALRELLASYVRETEELLWDAHEKGARILLEGAQGAHLDIDFGTYPYVTSSPCTPAGACHGSGLPPSAIRRVIGVAKAYPTRVGRGAFPTLIQGSLQEELRERGREYGATTGRPRNVGWPDLALLAYTAKLGVTEWAVTKLDVLTGLPTLKVCYAHEDAEGNPIPVSRMEEARPVYVEIPGWNDDLRGISLRENLPPETKQYLALIEGMTRVPVRMISTGPERNQLITA